MTTTISSSRTAKQQSCTISITRHLLYVVVVAFCCRSLASSPASPSSLNFSALRAMNSSNSVVFANHNVDPINNPAFKRIAASVEETSATTPEEREPMSNPTSPTVRWSASAWLRWYGSVRSVTYAVGAVWEFRAGSFVSVFFRRRASERKRKKKTHPQQGRTDGPERQ